MENAALSFSFAPEVAQLGVRGAYLVVSGLRNRESDASFEEHKRMVLEQLLHEYGQDGFLRDDPILAGFRDLHSRIGRSNRKYVASPEALVARFLRTGSFPRVNLVVDIYNIVSLTTRLALGAHDVRYIAGGVSLRLTDGSERFVPLGSTSPQPILPGEYGYVDGDNEVICRMEVLQVEKTKIEMDTTEAFFIVQGNANTPEDFVASAADELIELITTYCGGSVRVLHWPNQGLAALS
jgi:DNA/RNA-binding domain of Phe-tRNA-synthetase-like protein